MKIRMELLSDTIFGNGMSVPGAEDISVLTDAYGFPYIKGGTLKGIFREELIRLLELKNMDKECSNKDIKNEVTELLGYGGDDVTEGKRKLRFSDFQLSEYVRACVLKEIGEDHPEEILDLLTNTRMFTKMNQEGIVEEGTLRIARCVNKGLVFYGEIQCDETVQKDPNGKVEQDDKTLVKEVLGMMKYLGTMRNRGFGNVKLNVVEGGKS